MMAKKRWYISLPIMFKKMLVEASKRFKSISTEYLGNYFSIPKLAWLVLPLILMDTFVACLCLNIAVYFTKVRHFEPILIGEVVALYYGGSLFGALVGGTLTLKFSSMKLTSVSCFFLGICLLILLKTDELIELKIIMLFIGLLTNLLSTSNLASFIKTAGIDQKMKSKLVNLELAIFNLSFSLSAYVLISLGVEQIEYILIITSMSLCALGIYAFFIKNRVVFQPPAVRHKEKLCQPKSIKMLIGVLMTVIIVGLIYSMIKVIYAPTIENRFGDNGVSVFIASINPWIIFLLQPFLVNRLNRKSNIGLMGVGALIIGLGYFIFGFATTLFITVFALILLTFGEMLYVPISKSIIISIFEQGREGFALGLWRAVFLGSGLVGPFISGWIAQKYGNVLVWELCGILGFIGLLVCLLLSKKDKTLKLMAAN